MGGESTMDPGGLITGGGKVVDVVACDKLPVSKEPGVGKVGPGEGGTGATCGVP